MKKVYLILIVLVLCAILYYTLRIYRIDGTSMNYGLTDSDIVLCYRKFKTVNRGDMLVVRHPQDPDGRLYIKRCAALPGDRFFQKNRSFYLQIESNSTKTKQLSQNHDLEAIDTEWGFFIKDPYAKYYGVVHNGRLMVPSVLENIPLADVPSEHYYLLGDYRDNSADSRFFGAVPRDWVSSKVIYIFKQPKRWMNLINIKEAD